MFRTYRFDEFSVFTCLLSVSLCFVQQSSDNRSPILSKVALVSFLTFLTPKTPVTGKTSLKCNTICCILNARSTRYPLYMIQLANICTFLLAKKLRKTPIMCRHDFWWHHQSDRGLLRSVDRCALNQQADITVDLKTEWAIHIARCIALTLAAWSNIGDAW
jgi:hypothetical protein